jgi:hypothetical protein
MITFLRWADTIILPLYMYYIRYTENLAFKKRELNHCLWMGLGNRLSIDVVVGVAETLLESSPSGPHITSYNIIQFCT